MTALCDNGATIDCMTDGIGRVAGTFVPHRSDIIIGDSDATLVAEGTYVHALTLIAADGTEYDTLRRWTYTPKGVANIISEAREVNARGSTINWSQGSPRTIETADGACMPMFMTPNGLGWFALRPITDATRIGALLGKAGVDLDDNNASFAVLQRDTICVTIQRPGTVVNRLDTVA
eukprot:3127326-Prymnesium_polylepis.1